jgi:hypothetical protein
MKFDRQRPSHWLRAAWLSFVLVLSSLVAWLLPRSPQIVVVLSGHALSGNLLTLSEAAAHSDPRITWCYLAMSESTVPTAASIDVLRLWRIRDGVKLARASIVVTDHGPGLLAVLQKLRPHIGFIDVWHGLGFKDLGPAYGKAMSRYRAVVAASPWDAENQVRAAGVRQNQVETLGYSRMDTIVAARNAPARQGAQRRRRILVAPTWSHGVADDFDELTSSRVTRVLAEWAARRNWNVVVRAHLNVSEVSETSRNIRFMGMASFPDTVSLMVESDVLITDWSSIATDFHGLGRPVVFWDRPCPFSSLQMTPQDRVGPVVASVEELVEVLDKIASDDDWFAENFGSEQQKLLERVHESGLDGHASARLVEFLSAEVLS